MKRSAFLKAIAAAMIASVAVASSEPAPTTHAAAAAPVPASNADLDRLALALAIEAMNLYGPIYGEPRFWDKAYALLQSYGLDASWPTAQKLGNRFYGIRDGLIDRANAIKNPRAGPPPP